MSAADHNTHSKRSDENIWLIILMAAAFLLCLTMMCSVVLLGSGVYLLDRQYQTVVAPAIFTASFYSTASIGTSAAEATQIAGAEALAAAASNWPVEVTSTFDNNTEAWPAGQASGSYGAVLRRMENGKYIWELSDSKGQFWHGTPAMSLVSDFHASVEVRHISGEDFSAYGLIFRRTQKGDYYYFGIDDDSRAFILAKHYNDDWKTIIGWTYFPAINVRGVNKITMAASGSRFYFWINDQFAIEATDATLPRGKVGLAVEQGQSPEVIVVEFDNFSVKAPAPTPTPTRTPVYTPRPTATPHATLPFSVSGRIVFVSDGGLYLINADGSDYHQFKYKRDSGLISSAGTSPRFSPTGSSLVIRNGTSLELINLVGLGSNYWGHPTQHNVDPAWSPDGRRLALISAADGSTHDIFIWNFLDDSLSQVTTSIEKETDPTWSADGQQLAFTVFSEGKSAIQVIHLSSGEHLVLTNASDHAQYPDWSPDGEWIAFTSERDGNREIYLIRPDGTDLTRLTNNPAGDFDPTWSPDGQYLAFVSDRDGTEEIYIMRADGSQPTRLTRNIAREHDLDWGP